MHIPTLSSKKIFQKVGNIKPTNICAMGYRYYELIYDMEFNVIILFVDYYYYYYYLHMISTASVRNLCVHVDCSIGVVIFI